MELAVPKPGNVRAPGKLVDSDLYNIAERLRVIDPGLSLVLQEGHEKPWVVTEMGRDGEERFVARYEEADARILDHLRYMLAVPFKDRFERVAADVDKANENARKIDPEKLDRFAHEFQKAAVASNLSDPKWFRSYRPVKRKRAAVGA